MRVKDLVERMEFHAPAAAWGLDLACGGRLLLRNVSLTPETTVCAALGGVVVISIELCVF